MLLKRNWNWLRTRSSLILRIRVHISTTDGSSKAWCNMLTGIHNVTPRWYAIQTSQVDISLITDKLPAHHLIAKRVLSCDKICSFQSSQWQRPCIWCTCGCNFTERKCIVLPSVSQGWTLLLLLIIARHSGVVSAGDGHSGSWREKLPRVAWIGGRQIKV